ncbi:hypothetical protein [Bradyrhizobium sp. SZCCHNR1093]|uniref:hypothetical protein n=1 Tax=Bradyrhizobium sp. SZCCHNR1093 TaxID=3057368 RepID=UPI0028E66149|nr:hypothetical protein [Bradyrhizobium sp. SZCCHNR1093]
MNAATSVTFTSFICPSSDRPNSIALRNNGCRFRFGQELSAGHSTISFDVASSADIAAIDREGRDGPEAIRRTRVARSSGKSVWALCTHVVETRAARATARRIGRIEFVHEIKLISRTSLRSQEIAFHFSEIVHDACILSRREGRCARSSRHVRQGCGGREMSQHALTRMWTNDAARTRSRVVLASRC